MSSTDSESQATEIVRLEETLRQAMLASDVEQLDRLIADDLIFTDHTGQRQTKHSDLAAHRSGLLKLKQLDPLDRVVRSYGETAVVAVRLAVKGAFDGAEFSNVLCFTRVWVKRGKLWIIVAVHSSAVSEPSITQAH
jgi:ketosteroid isomerase-like protein